MLSSGTRVATRSSLQFWSRRSFQTRAHPKPIPQFTVKEAVEMVLQDVEARKEKREAKWERNAPKRAEKGIAVSNV